MPALSRTDGTLISLWNEGPREIEKYIRGLYEATPSLFDLSDGQLVAFF